MQLLIIKRRRAEAGAPHAPIPNGGDVGMPKADEYIHEKVRVKKFRFERAHARKAWQWRSAAVEAPGGNGGSLLG